MREKRGKRKRGGERKGYTDEGREVEGRMREKIKIGLGEKDVEIQYLRNN